MAGTFAVGKDIFGQPKILSLDEAGILKVTADQVQSLIPVFPEDIIFEFVKQVSGPVGTSSVDFNANYSGGNTGIGEFTINKVGKTGAIIKSLMFTIEDLNITIDAYGGIINGLTNGVQVQVISNVNTVLQTFQTDLFPIKQNYDWATFASGRFDIIGAVGKDLLIAILNFDTENGELNLGVDYKIRLIFNDDLSGLDKHRCRVDGRWTTTSV